MAIDLLKPTKGFTYIELLIALLLGVFIAATALQILYTSMGNDKQQATHADLQDTFVFAVPFLQRQLHKANYGATASSTHSGQFLSYDTPQGGVVLTATAQKSTAVSVTNTATTANLQGLLLNGRPINDDLLSRPEVSTSNVMGVASDQLTIQYQMPISGQFDCQGRAIPKNYYVIERYFVRKDNKTTSLACASTNYYVNADSSQMIDIARYTKPNGNKVNAYFSGKGSVIVPNVDYFHVLYGVTDTADNLDNNSLQANIKYIPASNSPEVTFDGLRVVSLKVGLIVKSAQVSQTITDNTFDLWDKSSLTLSPSGQSSQQLHQVITLDVFLRNAQGAI